MSSRAKPYSRESRPSSDGAWKHDLHDAVRTTLASRLASTSTSSSRSSSAAAAASSSSLAARLSNTTRELLPDTTSLAANKPKTTTSGGKMYGFDSTPPPNVNNPNAGRELLPADGKAARSARSSRSSRPRSAVDPGQRNLALSGLTAALSRDNGPRGAQVSIMGAARGPTWLRVSSLARGTTAEDVKSAFAPVPILTARLVSGRDERTATVELEIADRPSADGLIAQYDGVAADGEILSVVLMPAPPSSASRNSPRGGEFDNGNGGHRGGQRASKGLQDRLDRRGPPPSGKLYSDQADRGGSLAARLGGR